LGTAVGGPSISSTWRPSGSHRRPILMCRHPRRDSNTDISRVISQTRIRRTGNTRYTATVSRARCDESETPNAGRKAYGGAASIRRGADGSGEISVYLFLSAKLNIRPAA